MADKKSRDRDPYERSREAYTAEHSLAWLTALIALVMGVIGVLAAFGVIGGDEDAGVTNADEVGGADSSNWEDGALWLLPAISLGLLSRALHNNEHHTRRASATNSDDTNEAMFNGEHTAAYVTGALTVGSAAAALLVGFDVFDNGNSAEDGITWGLLAILLGVATDTFHSVRHHQLELDEDIFAQMLEERDSGSRPPATSPSQVRDRR